MLSKHEGAGNDFLVLVDADQRWSLTAAEARALCDRRRGVGADGLLICGVGDGTVDAGADLTMALFNADGSEAEMSGNGIRCLVQAATTAGLVEPGTVSVVTGAGLRTVEYHEGERPGVGTASVDMGPVRLGAERPSPIAGHRARLVDVGNPHLVVLGDLDLDQVDLARVGTAAARGVPGGLNVEIVAPGPGPEALRLRVWERGVGETGACGTGSCAAAAVARAWGVVGDRVQVHNPGGTLEVRLASGADGPAVLAGPVRHVADVVVAPAELSGGAADRWA